jgi:aromatic ring-opening dioxygenase LigB subunit
MTPVESRSKRRGVLRIRKTINHEILVIAPHYVVTRRHVAVITEHLNQPIVTTDRLASGWERDLIRKLSL